MKFGQISFKKLSNKAEYLQLDICGLSSIEVVNKYLKYNSNIPVILHGDWNKKSGCSENNINFRYIDYIDIVNSLKRYTEVLGITIHPPKRNRMSLEDFNYYCNIIRKSNNVNVYIENRSNKSLWLSTPNEIIDFSKKKIMTIDVPQLYISCNCNQKLFINCLNKIKWSNVKEIHLSNIKKINNRNYVARKIDDGEISFGELFRIIPMDTVYITLEILGGCTVFNNEKHKIIEMIGGLKEYGI